MKYIITSEPRIGVAFAEDFNGNTQARREFIKESHEIVPHELRSRMDQNQAAA